MPPPLYACHALLSQRFHYCLAKLNLLGTWCTVTTLTVSFPPVSEVPCGFCSLRRQSVLALSQASFQLIIALLHLDLIVVLHASVLLWSVKCARLAAEASLMCTCGLLHRADSLVMLSHGRAPFVCPWLIPSSCSFMLCPLVPTQ